MPHFYRCRFSQPERKTSTCTKEGLWRSALYSRVTRPTPLEITNSLLFYKLLWKNKPCKATLYDKTGLFRGCFFRRSFLPCTHLPLPTFEREDQFFSKEILPSHLEFNFIIRHHTENQMTEQEPHIPSCGAKFVFILVANK